MISQPCGTRDATGMLIMSPWLKAGAATWRVGCYDLAVHRSSQPMRESWIRSLLRLLGVICLLALFPFFIPRSWLDVGHRAVGLGEFPTAPIAEYLARSVCALCAFYGGLLLVLARDVQRYIAVI